MDAQGEYYFAIDSGKATKTLTERAVKALEYLETVSLSDSDDE